MLLCPGKCCGGIPLLRVRILFGLWDGKPTSLCTLGHAPNFKGHFLFTAWETEQNSFCLTEEETGGNWALDLWEMFLRGEQWKFPGWLTKVDAVYGGQEPNHHFSWFLQSRFLHFQHTAFYTMLAACRLLEERFCLFSANKCVPGSAAYVDGSLIALAHKSGAWSVGQ